MSNTPLRNSGNEDVERLLDRIDSGQRTAPAVNTYRPVPEAHETVQCTNPEEKKPMPSSKTNPPPIPNTTNASPEMPPEIGKQIKSAWVAACISGVVTLVMTLIAMAGVDFLDFDAWNLVDVALIVGLAFGIYKRSRVCAVTMLVYFVASKILIMVQTEKPTGLVLGLIFGYFFWQGIRGTFAYHKLKSAVAPMPNSQA